MSHTEYSAQFVQYSSVFLGLEEALVLTHYTIASRKDWGLHRQSSPFHKGF